MTKSDRRARVWWITSYVEADNKTINEKVFREHPACKNTGIPYHAAQVIAIDDIRPLIDALKFNMKEWEAITKEANNLVAWQKSRDALKLLPDEIVGGEG